MVESTPFHTRNSPDWPELMPALDGSASAIDCAKLVVRCLVSVLKCKRLALVTLGGSESLLLAFAKLQTEERGETATLRVPGPMSAVVHRAGCSQVDELRALAADSTQEFLSWSDTGAALLLPSEAAAALRADHATITFCRRLLAVSGDHAVVLPDSRHLEAMAEFSAGAGHEINNPLGSILGMSSALLKRERQIENRQALETIGAQAWRVRDMIGNAMTFARPPRLVPETFLLSEVVREVATTLRQRFEAAEVTIDLTQVAEHVVIDADRTQMGVLWEHLLRNAAESIRGSGRSGTVTVGLKYEQCGAISGIVRDDGPGFLTETDRRNAFNPFYSGRAAGRGLGFGLSLAWRVATAHRGVLVLESFVGGGLQASLSLPRSCEKVSTFATAPEAEQ